MNFSNAKVNRLPQTQIISWLLFNESGQKTSLKDYILYVLRSYPGGLTRPELSNIAKVEQNSLTAALLEHVKSGKLVLCGVRLNDKSSRHNQVYKLVR